MGRHGRDLGGPQAVVTARRLADLRVRHEDAGGALAGPLLELAQLR